MGRYFSKLVDILKVSSISVLCILTLLSRPSTPYIYTLGILKICVLDSLVKYRSHMHTVPHAEVFGVYCSD